MTEIDQMREEIAQLRRQAEQADALLAWMLGIAICMAENPQRKAGFSFDPTTLPGAQKLDGWLATIVEKVAAGQAFIPRDDKPG